MKRRSFLAAGALLALSGKSAAQSMSQIPMPPPPPPGDGEDFWREMRNHFPLDPNKVYLNNGTMGITPRPVIEALHRSYMHTAEQGAYPHNLEPITKAIAELCGAGSDEIAITKNVSESINLTAWGIPLKKDDEVILTSHEHVGGGFPWLQRAATDKIKLVVVHPGRSAAETLDNIKRAITNKTRVIAVPHIPCTIGQVFPVKEICDLARSRNIISALDGAHPLGMLQLDLKAIGCDYYSGCCHKWLLGPLGVGFFYVRKEMLNKTRIHHVAAYSNTQFNMNARPLQAGPLVDSAGRFSFGTYNGPLLEGTMEAINFYKMVGVEKVQTRVRQLSGNLQEGLLDMGKRIEMLTPVPENERGAQISFRMLDTKKGSNQEFVTNMAKKNIILRYVGESDIDCIRVSTHYYNSFDDIQVLLNELKTYLVI